MLQTNTKNIIKIKPCLVCNGTQGIELYVTEDFSYQLCLVCGLVSLMDQVSLNELSEFYDRGYEQQRHDVNEYEAAVERLKKKGSYEQKAKRTEEFSPYISGDSSVLEIGAGYGTFLKAIHDIYGAKVTGIEPGAIGSRVAKEHYGLDVKQGTLESELQRDAGSYLGKFDCVLMVHVLEHLTNPDKKLLDIKSLLSPGGYLYIAVPNLSQPDESLDKFFHTEHLTYFTPYTLARILSQVGLTPVSLKVKSKEMVMVASMKNSTEALDWESYQSEYSPATLLKILKEHDLKYTILQKIKGVLKLFLPSMVLDRLSNLVARTLRMIGLIRV